MDETQRWERLPDESARAFHGFCLYRDLPPAQRSLRYACKLMHGDDGNATTFFRWSRQYNWLERAAEHDNYLAEIERLRWAERRQQVREDDYTQGGDLRKLADQMIEDAGNYIKERRVIEDGTVIIYRQIDISIALKMIDLASHLQRLATGEPTQSINLSSSALDQLIQRELRRLANGGEEPGVGGEADDWDEEDEELDGE